MREPEMTPPGSTKPAPGREGKAYMPYYIEDTHGTKVAAEAARGTQSIVVPIKIDSHRWSSSGECSDT